MKIAIDWNTVVTTDRELWAAFIKEAVIREHNVTVITNVAQQDEEVASYATHLGARHLTYQRFAQAQDALSADIWIHGRLDRVVSVDMVNYLHEELNQG